MSLYVRPMIKISAAAISSVLTSAGLAWYSYTPPDERAAEVAYYSFGGMFAILFPLPSSCSLSLAPLYPYGSISA